MGVGKNILEILNKRCKIHELKKIILEVRESNLGAQAFYTKSGFNKIGLRKDYYQLEIKESQLFSCLKFLFSYLD